MQDQTNRFTVRGIVPSATFCGCNPPQRPIRPMRYRERTQPPDRRIECETLPGYPARRTDRRRVGHRIVGEVCPPLGPDRRAREENKRLTADNEALLQQIAALEAKLKQTQKELGEANELLIEMLTELNTWKSNILGFRGEMRDAAKARS